MELAFIAVTSVGQNSNVQCIKICLEYSVWMFFLEQMGPVIGGFVQYTSVFEVINYIM